MTSRQVNVMTTGTAEVPATEQAPASAGQELVIDMTKPGTHNLGTRKVAKLSEKHAKIWWVKFDGVKTPILCWKEPKKFAEPKIGDERELVVEVSEPKNGGALECWIKSYGEAKGGGNGNRNGWGGGEKKDDACIATQVILKEASECARHESLQTNKPIDPARIGAFAETLSTAYVTAYAKVKGVHGA